MVLRAQVQNCELRSHEKKKKDLTKPLDIEATGTDMWRQFQKNQNLIFLVIKAQVRTCEIRGQEKKKIS